jgi:hypothetical protein
MGRLFLAEIGLIFSVSEEPPFVISSTPNPLS